MGRSKNSKPKPRPKLSEFLSLRNVLSTILSAGILAILGLLWNLSGRVTALEAHVDDLRDLIVKRVVTETVTHYTTFYTVTGATYPFPPPLPGYPFESIITGLVLGFFLILLIHHEARSLLGWLRGGGQPVLN